MSDGPSLVTLFTDAGLCPRTHVATWAAWAKADGRKLERSGVLRDCPDTSDIAELHALVNGICLVIDVIKPRHGARIIAQTDCQSAIGAALGTGYRSQSGAARVAGALKVLRAKVREAGVTVEYRHVPGHAGKGTPRTAVNTWCDAECKRHLREARKALAAEQSEGANNV